MEEDDSPPMSPEATPTLRLSPPVSPEPEEATLNKLSPYNKALYEKIKSINLKMHKDKGESKGRSLLLLNEQVWLKPEVIEAVKKYKIKIIPTLEKLRQVIRSKTGITVSTSALSRHVRNIRGHAGKQRNSSEERTEIERKTISELTYLLNDHVTTTPLSQNLHTVIPKDNTSARLNTDMRNSSDEGITESSLLNDNHYTSPKNLHTVIPKDNTSARLNTDMRNSSDERITESSLLNDNHYTSPENLHTVIPKDNTSARLNTDMRNSSDERITESSLLNDNHYTSPENLHTVIPKDNTSARLNTDMGNSSGEGITESSLLNDHLYTTPENLHTVSPEEDNDTYLNPEFASIPEVTEALTKYRNFEIATLEELREVIHEKADVWISTTALSWQLRNVKRVNSSGEIESEFTHSLNDHVYTSPEYLHTVTPQEDNATSYLNPEIASKPEVKEALNKYRNYEIATLEELRQVIHEKANVWISTTALSWQRRNVRGNSGEKTSEFTPLLNDPTSGSKNLHTVRPQARKATSNVVKQNRISKNLDMWSKPVVIAALNKYRNFEIATLEQLRQVIHEKAKVWVSTIELSRRVRNMRKLGRGRPKGSEPKVSYAVNNYVVKPRGGDVALPALPLLYQPEEVNEAETTSGDVDGEVVNDESDLKSPSTFQVPVTWVDLKTKHWRPRKRKLDRYASKTGRQVRGEFVNNRNNVAVFQLKDGPNRNYTYRMEKKAPDSSEEDPQRYSCAQCHHARYGARKNSKRRGLKGDDLAPLNPGPHKRIMVMPDGLVLNIDEGQHHQDCKPWSDAQMILYRERVDITLKRKMGIKVGKQKREHRKRSKEEQERYLDEKEKVRQCVMRLDAVGVPITQIGPTITFIRETLAEFPLDITPSHKAIKSIVYRQKKKLEKEANCVIASPPISVDRKVPKRPKKSPSKIRSPSDVTLDYDYEPEYERVVIIDDDHIQRSRKSQSKIRSPSNMTLKYDYEPETRVVVVDSMDDDDHIQAPYFPYRDGPNGYGSRRHSTSQDYSF